jgi:hypothetical protein
VSGVKTSGVRRGLVILLAVTALVGVVWWAADRPPRPDGAGSQPPGDRGALVSDAPEPRWGGPSHGTLPSDLPAPTGPSRPDPTARQVEETVRRIFAAFNAQDLEAFLAGWTPQGFQRAFQFPMTAAVRLRDDLFAESGPYTIDGFASTVVGPHGATTHVEMTNGRRKERHRLALVKDADAWKIDVDEKLPARPARNVVAVEVRITERSLEVSNLEVVSESVAFRVANGDEKAHQLVVLRRVVESGAQESLGHVGPLGPGERATLLLTDLVPGPYVLVDNTLDSDGMPYSSKGFRAELTIR